MYIEEFTSVLPLADVIYFVFPDIVLILAVLALISNKLPLLYKLPII